MDMSWIATAAKNLMGVQPTANIAGMGDVLVKPSGAMSGVFGLIPKLLQSGKGAGGGLGGLLSGGSDKSQEQVDPRNIPQNPFANQSTPNMPINLMGFSQKPNIGEMIANMLRGARGGA